MMMDDDDDDDACACMRRFYNFQTQGTMIEGGPDSGVDMQLPWETFPNK